MRQGRKLGDDLERMRPFARWMVTRIRERRLELKEVADRTGIDYSYLYKITKSYRPSYAQHDRPSYDKAVQIGTVLGDVAGALEAGGFTASGQAGAVGEAPAPYHADGAGGPETTRLVRAYHAAPDELRRVFDSLVQAVHPHEPAEVG